MPKPSFRMLAIGSAIAVLAGAAGYAGLMAWRHAAEPETLDDQVFVGREGETTTTEVRDKPAVEKELEQDILAGIPAIEEGIRGARVLVSPSERFVAYLDFVPGAGLTDVKLPMDAPYSVRTTGVVTIRDTKLGRELQVTPGNVAEPIFQRIPEDAPITFFIYPYFAKWSDDESEVWGTIELHDPADPSFPLHIEVFYISVKDITEDYPKEELPIQFFSIPHGGWPFAVKPEMVNPEARMVLIEETNPAGDIVLALTLYELDTLKKLTVVVYTEEQLDAHFGEENYLRGISYYIPRWFPGWDEMDSEEQAQLGRSLEPRWVDPRTFSYFDFITRAKVHVAIE